MKVQIISSTAQKFDGVTYYLCGYYYQRKGKRLHRTVWEYHNGPIPEGFHVHHVDGDRSNNEIDNLALMDGHDHLSEHMNRPDRIEHSKRAIEIAREAACEWHGSDAGREWHSKHGKEAMAKRELVAYVCDWCGKEFKTKRRYAEGEHHFCSNNCKAKHRYHSGVDSIEKVCPTCGKTFVTNKHNDAVGCSPWCTRRWRAAHED